MYVEQYQVVPSCLIKPADVSCESKTEHLNQPGHYSNCVQCVAKVVYCSGFHVTSVQVCISHTAVRHVNTDICS